MRISNITKGSTNAVMVSSPSSNQASTYKKTQQKYIVGYKQLTISLKQTFNHVWNLFLPFRKLPYNERSSMIDTKESSREDTNWTFYYVIFFCTLRMYFWNVRLGRNCGCAPGVKTDGLSSATTQAWLYLIHAKTKHLMSQLCEFTGMLTLSRKSGGNWVAECFMSGFFLH